MDGGEINRGLGVSACSDESGLRNPRQEPGVAPLAAAAKERRRPAGRWLNSAVAGPPDAARLSHLALWSAARAGARKDHRGTRAWAVDHGEASGGATRGHLRRLGGARPSPSGDHIHGLAAAARD
jgi:hypothetical protein